VTATVEKLHALARRARESADTARERDLVGAALLDQAAEAYEQSAALAATGRDRFVLYLNSRNVRRKGA
jgi:hypothetical protein